MHPSPATVERARFWANASVRAITVGLIVLWTAQYAGILLSVATHFAIGLVTTPEFVWGLGTPIAAILLIALRSTIVNWLFPFPDAGCPKCGYAAANEAVRCPECGLSLQDTEPT